MERPLNGPSQVAASKTVRGKSPHLMCGTPFLGIAGAAAAAYFAYLSYGHLSNADYSLPHTWWTTLAYAVWTIVLGGLLTETRCWRERIFFSLMLLVVLLSFVFSAWSTAPEHAIRGLRMASTALWVLAALASLATAFASSNKAGPAPSDSPEGAK